MGFEQYTKKINLDFEVAYIKPIDSKQGDIKSRFLEFTVFDQGQPMNLEGISSKIYAKKPDGHEIFNDCTIKDNKILVELTSQFLAVPGKIKCELLLLDKDLSKLTSKIFIVNCLESINTENAIESSNEYGVLENLIDDVNKAKENIGVIGSLNEELLKNIKAAQEINATLEITIKNANDINNTLLVTIKNATDINTTLVTDTSAAADKIKELQDMINEANGSMFITNDVFNNRVNIPEWTKYINWSKKDLNDIKANNIVYGESMVHAPNNEFFYVQTFIENTPWSVQIAYAFGSKSGGNKLNGKVYKRVQLNGEWQPWDVFYSSDNKPTTTDIGAINKTGDTVSGTLKFKSKGNELEVYNDSGAKARGMVLKDTSENIIGMIGANFQDQTLKNLFLAFGAEPWATKTGFSVDTKGIYFNNLKVPVLGSDGGTEVGEYIDFHANGSDLDYTVRAKVANDDSFHLDRCSGLFVSGAKVHIDAQATPLWKGYHHMTETETIVPTKKLSQCKNGWVFVWSDFNEGGTGESYNICLSYIPKNTTFKTGEGYNLCTPADMGDSSYTAKYIYISDDKLTGHKNNKTGLCTDVVIRAVLEY